jgi:Lrp/AsnC family transcriptional regulator, leucine-responsive regulatory protein
MDDIDRRILHVLQRDARTTHAALAQAVGLSAPAVFERVRKLEQQGIIQGYGARVNAAALGKPLTAFVRLTVAYDERHAAGVAWLRDDADVLECYSVAGEDCYVLKTRVDSPAGLERLNQRIRARLTVLRSVTMIALSAVKEDGPLSVDLDEPAAAAPPVTTVRGNSGAPRGARRRQPATSAGQ